MGLFDIFKKKPKFIDELFGELNYTKFGDSSKNFYDGSVTFDSQQAGVNIDADENGPTKNQKEFYIKLRDNYPTIKNEIIKPYLLGQLKDWLAENPILDFDKEFTIDGISLSRISDKPVEWSLTLYSIKIEHYVTIEFLDFDPQGVIVDG
jgi:hypothetical protein